MCVGHRVLRYQNGNVDEMFIHRQAGTRELRIVHVYSYTFDMCGKTGGKWQGWAASGHSNVVWNATLWPALNDSTVNAASTLLTHNDTI